jgi:hypothetical protein
MRNIFWVLILVTFAVGCKEKYNPGITYPNTGYLVVEGFINSGIGATSIRLSRTVKLTDAVSIKYENNAQLKVEGDDNSSFTLPFAGNGLYGGVQVPVNGARKYRLRIRTTDNKEYLSDFTGVVRTPPIDSVSWTREAKGAQIHINTHDPQDKTWYYTWNYEETWEYRSIFISNLKYIKDISGNIINVGFIFPNPAPDTTVYRCWSFQNSVDILLGSSKKLTHDVIHLPLLDIEEGSVKLSQLYSIKVYQHGLSEKGYEFLQRMKKNTQQVGSIFDAQPSELNSNIHNVANPLETVVGFVDVADGYEARIFIDGTTVPRWHYVLTCEERDVPNNKDSLQAYSYLAPVSVVEYGGNGNILSIHAASEMCVNCLLRGGTNKKPAYWPR